MANERVTISFLPSAERAFHKLDFNNCWVNWARETISFFEDSISGNWASVLSIDFESSHRMAMRGLVVGLITVSHSGCQSRLMTSRPMKNRRHSSTKLRFLLGLRL